MERASQVRDIGAVCTMGEAAAHPMDALTRRTPHLAMMVSDGVSALCAEEKAWEADLGALIAQKNALVSESSGVSGALDAQIQARRHHALAAERFERAFRHFESHFGEIKDQTCPSIKERDEFNYLFGLLTGTLALLHDRNAAGMVGVPLSRLLDVGRATRCLNNDRWWGVPDTLTAAAAATIPGAAPRGTDPWQALDDAAANPASRGTRAANALRVWVAANAGDTQRVEDGIRAHAAANDAHGMDPKWVLIDEYANRVVQYWSDRLWIEAEGHRTEVLGELPGDEPLESQNTFDPFATPSTEHP